MKTTEDKIMLTAMQLAKELDLHYASVMRYKKLGLPYTRSGKKIFFVLAISKEWIKNREEETCKKRQLIIADARKHKKVKINQGDVVIWKGKPYIAGEEVNDAKYIEINRIDSDYTFFVPSIIIAPKRELTLYARKVKGGEK